MKRTIQLLTLAVGILFSIDSVHAQYPYYQQALLSERVGFAEKATGGAGGEVYWVTNFHDDDVNPIPGSLRYGLGGDTPRWIMFAVSGNFYPVSKIYMGSNKTIDGRGASVSFYNNGFAVQSRNVIFVNLNMQGGTGDGITIKDGSGDVWIHHCSFGRTSGSSTNSWGDEAIGITTPTATAWTDVTISWCKFFRQDKVILIGGYDGIPYGERMRVTLHHNWFNGTGHRHPRIRKALVHAYNNYMVNWITDGMVSAESAELLTENNIFHAGSQKKAAVVTNYPPQRGFARNTNNWKLNGATDAQWMENDVFNPISDGYYGYAAEAADSILRTKIQTFSGATYSLGGFANMSTRAHVQGGEGVLISGFYISGSGSKKLVIRAIGPSLEPWIPDAMDNPVLRIYNSFAQEIAYNDNWGSSPWAAEVQASGLAPSHYLEAAVLLNLAPGSYSAAIDGWGTGIASVEVYDIDPLTTPSTSKLINISSRATVEPNNPPIAGLIFDSGIRQTIILGKGPSLANAGIQNPIGDPILTLYDANGTEIATNNNWGENPDVPAGWAPSDWRESVLVINRGSGNYTTILRDYWGATGIGSIEIYKLQ
jgi:pectate lyase